MNYALSLVQLDWIDTRKDKHLIRVSKEYTHWLLENRFMPSWAGWY